MEEKSAKIWKSVIKYKYHILIELLLFFLAVFVWRTGIATPSSYTDLSYHLATAQGFSRAGGVVTWDFWESLPIGRPHNYPPLFHAILASFLNFGLKPSVAIKLMMEITLVGGLLLYSIGLIKLFGAKVSFWATFLLAFSFHFIQLSLTVMPGTIVVFLAPILFYFLFEKKWLKYCIVLLFMFYLHLFIPYIILGSLGVYLFIFDRKLFAKAITPSLIAFLFYCPWLIHIFSGGVEYIKYLDNKSTSDLWREFVLVNLFVTLLWAAGALLAFFNRSRIDKKYFLFFISGLAILSPSFLMAGRLIDGHFLPFAAVISTIPIVMILQGKQILSRISFFLILFLYMIWNPTLSIGSVREFELMNSSITFLLHQNFPIENDPAVKLNRIITTLKRSSEQGDTIATFLNSWDGYPVDKNYNLSISNIFASYTGLATLNLRQPEIYKRPFPELDRSKFILLNSDPSSLSYLYFSGVDPFTAQDMIRSIRGNFEVITSTSFNENETIYVYKNKSNLYVKEVVTRSNFPLWLTDLIVLFLIAFLFVDMKKYEKS